MTALLGELGLTELVTGIDGMSALSGAVILAETGDLSRFASGRAVVKHAGLNPSERTSATINGQARISRRGRPALRSAAWRAVWGALRHNRVLAAKHAHLTGRDANRLAGGPGPHRVRRGAAALAVGRDHHRPGVGRQDRRRGDTRAAPRPAVTCAAAA